MKRQKRHSIDNNWISFSDIMTGLMVIFMFIAISYIMEVQKQQNEILQQQQETERRKKELDLLLTHFSNTNQALYQTLENTFEKNFTRWGMVLDKDLTIKFTQPEVLFNQGKTDINPYFQNILNHFLPQYFSILLDPKYRDNITEIRIEGHTDSIPAPQYDNDPYIGNIILSQLRSAAVLKYFYQMPYYQHLSAKDKQKLQFLLTANGLSFGRTLDDDGRLTLYSGKPANDTLSRRVEFRIVTRSAKLIEEGLQLIEKHHATETLSLPKP